MSDLVNKSTDLFGQGCNCAQAILVPYAPELGLPADVALKVAAGFGGGVGRQGEVCGAVSGAVMVIGLRHWDGTGSRIPSDAATKERVYGLVRQFSNAFRERHGSILCRELLGCDIATAEGLSEARQHGLFKSVCPALVADAAELLEREAFIPPPTPL